MEQTYKNFKELSTLHTGETDLNKLAEIYQTDADPIILAYIFCKQYPYILTQVNKYFYLTDSDRASFAVEELHKAMMDFDATKGAKLATLFSRYLNRRLYAETKMMNHKKRCANNSADCYEAFAELKKGYEETGFDDAEFIHTLETSQMLTDNELKYCKIIMRESSKVTDSEIARELKVTSSAINQMKKSIKRKFLTMTLSFT